MDETNQPMKRYGLSGAENMYLSVAEVYEHVIDGVYPEDATVIIEEWSVLDNIEFMPSPEWVLDNLLEYSSDQSMTEGWYESAEKMWTVDDPEIAEMLNRLRQVLAEKVTFCIADRQLRTLTLEINGGHPKIDGENLYVRSPE